MEPVQDQSMQATGPVRVLVVVELGANWGHLLRLRPVLREMRSRHHEALLAVSDVEAAQRLLAGEGITIVKCPGALSEEARKSEIDLDCYAQILDRCVFGGEDVLAQTVRQWGELLESWTPDVILVDFAPTALFIAHLHRLPVVQLVIGWEAPPPGETLPVIRPWRPIGKAEIVALEAAVVARLNNWCEKFGVAPYRWLSDLYAEGTQLLASLPETDHFAPRVAATYIGPIASTDYGSRVDWPAADGRGAQGKRVIAYLASDSRNMPIMAALRNLGVSVVAVLPGLPDRAVRLWRNACIEVRRDAVQLEPLLASADLVIHNAGHGTAATSLLAGVPVLTLPRTVEQALLTRRMKVTTGAVLSVLEEGGLPNCQRTIHRMLHDKTIREAAQAVARRYAGSTQFRSILGAVDAVERTAAQGTKALTRTEAVPLFPQI